MGESDNLMQSYYLYSAILALKFLALVPLAKISCSCEKLQRANLSDLKKLTPFWLVAGLFMTTSPDRVIAVDLLRAFVVARFVAVLGYLVKLPRQLIDLALLVSFAVPSFMAVWVIAHYKNDI